MDTARLEALLTRVADGDMSPETAVSILRDLPFQDLGFAKIDLHRHLRQGMAEVIFCPGKTAEQIAIIAANLKSQHDLVLATRAEPAQAQAVQALMPTLAPRYEISSRVLVWGELPDCNPALPVVAVVTAGTADLPVASEAAIVLRAHAVPVRCVNDAGVAGLHRLFAQVDVLKQAGVIICVAGMDGALPSVLAGLMPQPVIAVPTSVGYGASFDGLAALLTMLNSCAAGVTVVNIDNGFGAACAALRLIGRRSGS